VLDDDPRDLELAHALLEARGHVVVPLGDSADLLKVERPDVVVIDIRLPGGDGVTLMRQMRAAGWDRVPFIAYTAEVDTQHVRAYMAAGFDALFPKPVDVRRFARDVEAVWSESCQPASEGPDAAG